MIRDDTAIQKDIWYRVNIRQYFGIWQFAILSNEIRLN